MSLDVGVTWLAELTIATRDRCRLFQAEAVHQRVGMHKYVESLSYDRSWHCG